MITLNLDDSVLDRAAGTAAFFQLAGQRPDAVFIQRNANDDRDRLSPAPFRLTPDPDDAVASRRPALFTANAAVDRPGTLGADPARV